MTRPRYDADTVYAAGLDSNADDRAEWLACSQGAPDTGPSPDDLVPDPFPYQVARWVRENWDATGREEDLYQAIRNLPGSCQLVPLAADRVASTLGLSRGHTGCGGTGCLVCAFDAAAARFHATSSP